MNSAPQLLFRMTESTRNNSFNSDAHHRMVDLIWRSFIEFKVAKTLLRWFQSPLFIVEEDFHWFHSNEQIDNDIEHLIVNRTVKFIVCRFNSQRFLIVVSVEWHVPWEVSFAPSVCPKFPFKNEGRTAVCHIICLGGSHLWTSGPVLQADN